MCLWLRRARFLVRAMPMNREERSYQIKMSSSFAPIIHSPFPLGGINDFLPNFLSPFVFTHSGFLGQKAQKHAGAVCYCSSLGYGSYSSMSSNCPNDESLHVFPVPILNIACSIPDPPSYKYSRASFSFLSQSPHDARSVRLSERELISKVGHTPCRKRERLLLKMGLFSQSFKFALDLGCSSASKLGISYWPHRRQQQQLNLTNLLPFFPLLY